MLLCPYAARWTPITQCLCEGWMEDGRLLHALRLAPACCWTTFRIAAPGTAARSGTTRQAASRARASRQPSANKALGERQVRATSSWLLASRLVDRNQTRQLTPEQPCSMNTQMRSSAWLALYATVFGGQAKLRTAVQRVSERARRWWSGETCSSVLVGWGMEVGRHAGWTACRLDVHRLEKVHSTAAQDEAAGL